MTLAEVERAIRDAETALLNGLRGVKLMARLVGGKLRAAFPEPDYFEAKTLRALKRELRDFDATRGTWKDR